MSATNYDKWMISLSSSILFLVFSLPITFSLSNQIFSSIGFVTYSGGSPTIAGIVLHAFLFGLVVRIMMN